MSDRTEIYDASWSSPRSNPLLRKIAQNLAASDRRAYYFMAKGLWSAARDYRSWSCTKLAAKNIGIWIMLTTLRTVRGHELVREHHWK